MIGSYMIHIHTVNIMSVVATSNSFGVREIFK